MLQDVIDSIPVFGKVYLKEEFIGECGMSITRVVPVKQIIGDRAILEEGAAVIFNSQVMLQTNKGPMAVTFAIPAQTLEGAVQNWQAAAKLAVAEITEQQREAQRRIVVPDLIASKMN